jgi:benzodiazapine receptor
MMGRYGSLAVFLVVTVVVSMAASGFEAGAWYFDIAARPAGSAPPWLLGIVWAIAWLALALSGWQLWATGDERRRDRLILWAALLLLTGAWHAVIFGLHRPGWSWLLLGIVLGLAVFGVRWFRGLSRQASVLLVPFAVWIAYLWLWNLAFWTINGGYFLRFLD